MLEAGRDSRRDASAPLPDPGSPIEIRPGYNGGVGCVTWQDRQGRLWEAPFAQVISDYGGEPLALVQWDLSRPSWQSIPIHPHDTGWGSESARPDIPLLPRPGQRVVVVGDTAVAWTPASDSSRVLYAMSRGDDTLIIWQCVGDIHTFYPDVELAEVASLLRNDAPGNLIPPHES